MKATRKLGRDWFLKHHSCSFPEWISDFRIMKIRHNVSEENRLEPSLSKCFFWAVSGQFRLKPKPLSDPTSGKKRKTLESIPYFLSFLAGFVAGVFSHSPWISASEARAATALWVREALLPWANEDKHVHFCYFPFSTTEKTGFSRVLQEIFCKKTEIPFGSKHLSFFGFRATFPVNTWA